MKKIAFLIALLLIAGNAYAGGKQPTPFAKDLKKGDDACHKQYGKVADGEKQADDLRICKEKAYDNAYLKHFGKYPDNVTRDWR